MPLRSLLRPRPSAALGSFVALLGGLALHPPALAQSCQFDPSYGSYAFTGSQAGAPGFTCTVGDKTFSNFSGKAVREDLQFELYTAGSSHFVKITSTTFAPGTTWDVAYDVAANDPTIVALSTYAGSNFSGPDPYDLFASLKDTISGQTATYTNVFGVETAVPAPINPSAQNLVLQGLLDVKPGSTTNADLWIQKIQQSPVPPVPGPLPILGAGMAFGFSRRLRRRIRRAS